MFDEFDSYEPHEDDLSAWEEEQVFQDAMLEREELYEEGAYSDDARQFGDDDFGPFGIDGMGPDFE
jgi:hypothetical protein